jgi:hypothetical protein
MQAVIRYVARQPRKSKKDVAETAGNSIQYGYQAADRCLSRGLIELDPNHPYAEARGKGAVVLTQAGLEYAVYELGLSKDEISSLQSDVIFSAV